MPLADWLKARGMTPAECAKEIGCHRITLERILPGKDGSKPRRKPGWKLLKKINAATDGEVTANDFMDVPDPDPR